MASFCRIDNKSSHLPCMLSALEEQTFIFQLQLQEKEEQQSSKVRRHNGECVLTFLKPVRFCENKFSAKLKLPNDYNK